MRIRKACYDNLVVCELVDEAGEIIATSHPLETEAFAQYVNEAHGDVLVLGYGLGLLTEALLSKPEVRTVTVVERDERILCLARPDPKLILINADAWEYEPTKEFDVGIFDIWSARTYGDHYEQLFLCMKYAPFVKKVHVHYYAEIRSWINDLDRPSGN